MFVRNAMRMKLYLDLLCMKSAQIQIFFVVRISPYLDSIPRLISVFSLNTGEYGPEKTVYMDTFHAMLGL